MRSKISKGQSSAGYDGGKVAGKHGSGGSAPKGSKGGTPSSFGVKGQRVVSRGGQSL
jgi:hypothetical protein